MKAEKALGQKIKELCEKKGISHRELADMVGITEVSMYRYINGERVPRAPELINFAKALNVDPAYLFGIDLSETETSPDTATIESTRRAILREAEKNICGQREQDYGSPESNFAIIAELWTAYTGHEFSALDVAMMMVLLKVARIKNGGGTGDSFVDLAGYAACGGEIHERTT